MREKRGREFYLSLLIVLLFALAFLVFVIGGCQKKQSVTQTDGADTKLPNLIGIAAFSQGSTSYVVGEGICRAIEKGAGIKARQIPSGNDPGRIEPVRKKEAHLAMLSTTSLYMCNVGGEDFAVPNWGPQPFRGVWCGGDCYYGVFTRADSNIYKATDLKGKKLPIIPGSPFIHKPIEAYISYVGLSPKDAKWITYTSYSDEMKAVAEGALDAGYASTTPSTLYELASTHGVRWVSLEPLDEKRWKETIGHMLPHYSKPCYADRGAGISKEKPVLMFGGPLSLITYPWLSDEVAYAITKALWENYDVYKDVSDEAASWTHEAALNLVGRQFYPMHPGSKKFFQDIGVWNEKIEKWDRHCYETEKKREAAWDEAIKAGKVGKEGWKDEWLKKVVDIEFNTP
jgi:hypothetical protein